MSCGGGGGAVIGAVGMVGGPFTGIGGISEGEVGAVAVPTGTCRSLIGACFSSAGFALSTAGLAENSIVSRPVAGLIASSTVASCASSRPPGPPHRSRIDIPERDAR
jgi:hypothetical protein